MAVKIIDLRKLMSCEESEASVKITDESGEIHYFKNKVERTTSRSKMYWSDLGTDKEWFAGIELSSNTVDNTKYIELVDWWFNSAFESDAYKQRINSSYTKIDIGIEMDKAYNWLCDHPDQRKTSLNGFVNGWLKRASDRK